MLIDFLKFQIYFLSSINLMGFLLIFVIMAGVKSSAETFGKSKIIDLILILILGVLFIVVFLFNSALKSILRAWLMFRNKLYRSEKKSLKTDLAKLKGVPYIYNSLSEIERKMKNFIRPKNEENNIKKAKEKVRTNKSKVTLFIEGFAKFLAIFVISYFLFIGLFQKEYSSQAKEFNKTIQLAPCVPNENFKFPAHCKLQSI